ncbi:sensor histidine kinase [Lysinibacillus yapensis]|uniref:histidine kinase n=1 Tax=Ureibacillus yapensis TaxID=2304605 RepID=A0A396S6U9_9BACL|nr:HAMP domain-containing sensor histidine kinase [Lysinibacillus yapensis]RHW36194.1 sensor histidine kinase [Lysinibacillus yapensis]
MKTIITNPKLKSYYYITAILLILIMAAGLFLDNPLIGSRNFGYTLHIIFVTMLSITLLLYPRYPKSQVRWLIVLISIIYIYTMFIIYPETGSTIILIYFIPALPIVFFDKPLFYSSVIVNIIVMTGTVLYIVISGDAARYPIITDEPVGNFLNFLSSQVVLFFIFYMTAWRINKMQLYYEQVKHAERLKTTGQLAAAVAHEIRNPLTVVKGYLQLYEQDSIEESKLKQNLPLLIGELESAEQVISHLLSLSKPSKELTERVDVKKAVYGVTDLLHSYGLLNKSTIEVFVEENCSIKINRIELHQVLVNIVKNAIEASPAGGTISVNAGTMGGMVQIQVSDQGIGMTQEEVEFMGTPFYSLKNKGTGLGVMICHNIVKKYNGSITYKSVKGQGTKVTISFPVSK